MVQLVTGSVPVTTYWVVAVGEAMGLAIEPLFKAVAGNQVYAPAPVATSCAEPKLHVISLDLLMLITGTGNTLRLVVSVVEVLQVFSFIKTEYPASALPAEEGFAMLGFVTKAAGLHK